MSGAPRAVMHSFLRSPSHEIGLGSQSRVSRRRLGAQFSLPLGRERAHVLRKAQPDAEIPEQPAVRKNLLCFRRGIYFPPEKL